VGIEASLTFALPTKNRSRRAGFPRFQLASADVDAQNGAVETYPLEVDAAKVR
jgi:hypothetical protein